MTNNSRFFENNKCEYFPCHKGLKDFNCLFCYCPFYAWEKCPGLNSYIEKADGRRIKVCTDCTFPHIPQNYDYIMKLLRDGEEAFNQKKEALPPKFYGIGVGPGDSLLITKKALKTIKSVSTLILPAKDKESCRAYNIVEKALPSIKTKECIFTPFPMSMKEPFLTNFHKETASKIEKLIDEGKSVGFLTIGDVSIYSTFAYIEAILLSHGYKTESINGIPSFCLAAAACGIPLALGSEEIHIIPGSADIDKALQLTGTLVFMKSGKNLAALKERLITLEKDRSLDVRAVSNCGMEDELVTVGASNINTAAGYLTVVLVLQR